MNNSLFFQRLFKYSKKITPYLDGKIEPLTANDNKSSIIYIKHCSLETINDLYENLKQLNPEAGPAYWLTRTWNLLCWQPIYIAFISIYACRGLPHISSIIQHVQKEYISGYQFESQSYIRGSEEYLIFQAAQELNKLFNYFQKEMSSWISIRPGFATHLFTSSVLDCLVRLSELLPSLSEKYLFKQARLWFQACDFPERSLKSLSYDHESKKLFLTRRSCCLVYKCHGQSFCDDCPRVKKSK